ncbi:MAG: AMP-binding protein [Actinophytocola sp.]|nr:AMP-binding protein [Actinophytocola sp.]
MSVDTALHGTHPAEGVGTVAFAADLARHGERTALIDAHGQRLTYRELAEKVDVMRARLGTERRLVLVAASNDVEPIVAYLAALSGGHPVLLANAGDAAHLDDLIAGYDPDVVIDGDITERRPGTAHTLHPELALLLSTSGSTGSPKLVRLSARNVQSNAEAIARYLAITDTDRAITSLPMQYCYGLSVINSNLLRGAGLVLTDASMIEPEFWTLFREHHCTSLHGVPYTFDLLDRAGFARMELPSLRYVTQAGGKLSAERVAELAARGEREGWQLFVMYGQTEATARMAYLPPELARTRPDSIGVAIPGGDLALASESASGEGELIYRGPNVMLGYAESPADLAEGRTVTELATGDLARRTGDGLFEITGRSSRFIKISGLRIDLDRVEALCAERGHAVRCTGDDEGLVVAVSSAEDVAPVTELVTSRLCLPAGAIRVGVVAETARLPSGKVDYAALAAAVGTPETGDPAVDVREIFARVLPRYAPSDIGDADTFVTLGGDSLSYVRASIELEKVLGEVPPNWPSVPVGELERQRPRHRWFPLVETNIVLRAIAVVLVVGTHVELFRVLGGAHLLLILAGWSFARFCLPSGSERGTTTTSRAILRSAVRIAIPSMLWLAWRMLAAPDVSLANVLLVHNYVGTTTAVGYWFVEVMVQTLLLLAVLFAIPAVRRAERRYPFLTPLVVFAGSLTGRLFIGDIAHWFEWAMTTHAMAWFFALGWLAFRARSRTQQLIVVAAALLTVPGFFENSVREGIPLAGLLLVLFLPRLRLPRVLVPLIGLVASASLYIYLTHFAAIDALAGRVPGLVVTLAGIGLGIAVWFAAERAMALTGRAWRGRAARHHGRRAATC